MIRKAWFSGLVAVALMISAGVVGLDREARAIEVGAVAPELQSTQWLNGSETSLAELRGKVVLIEFWAHW